jgi:hypothetical protein
MFNQKMLLASSLLLALASTAQAMPRRLEAMAQPAIAGQ